MTKNQGSIYWWRISGCPLPPVRALEVMIVCEEPIAHNQEQEDLLQEQRYTVEKTTFIVEPRFKTEGRRSIASVLFQLMQNEIDI